MPNPETNLSRTWKPTVEGGILAPEIIEINDTADLLLAFDYSEILNPNTILSSINEVVEDGTTNTPTISGQVLSEDKQRVIFRLSGLAADTQTRIRCDATTTDSDRISVMGWVYTL